MIIKEDTPAVFTGRSTLASAGSLSTTSSRTLPPTPSESIPSYRPPSLPPPAHIPTADPAPWRTGPPPRYKFRKRPLRLLPLLLSLALAAIVLGSAVNFMVESVIKISRVHIKAQMFAVFQRILKPTLVLIAGTVFTILVLPIHHLLPIPSARVPFRAAPHRHRSLVVFRLLLPAINTVFYLVGGCWYLSVALVRGDDLPSSTSPGGFNGTTDGGAVDDEMQSGNGVDVHRDMDFPYEADFWTPWFFRDPNVKMVVFATAFAVCASGVYLANAIPGSWVHRVCTGIPPAWLGRWETKLVRLWRRNVVGRATGAAGVGEREREADEAAEVEEMEGMLGPDDAIANADDDLAVVDPTAEREGLDDQTERGRRRRLLGLGWAGWDRDRRVGLGRRIGLVGGRSSASPSSSGAGGRRGAGPLAI